MSNIKIDNKTLNIVMDVLAGGDYIKVYIPPADTNEVASNALILGAYTSYLDEVGSAVLITDYKVYIKEAVLKAAENQKNKEIFINDSTNRINALLERSIQSGYYFEGNKPVSLSKLDEEIKDMIKGKLLFFIVLSRYIRPQIPKELWEERMNYLGFTYTSLTYTEYSNSIMTALLEKKTSEGQK